MEDCRAFAVIQRAQYLILFLLPSPHTLSCFCVGDVRCPLHPSSSLRTSPSALGVCSLFVLLYSFAGLALLRVCCPCVCLVCFCSCDNSLQFMLTFHLYFLCLLALCQFLLALSCFCLVLLFFGVYHKGDNRPCDPLQRLERYPGEQHPLSFLSGTTANSFCLLRLVRTN